MPGGKTPCEHGGRRVASRTSQHFTAWCIDRSIVAAQGGVEAEGRACRPPWCVWRSDPSVRARDQAMRRRRRRAGHRCGASWVCEQATPAGAGGGARRWDVGTQSGAMALPRALSVAAGCRRTGLVCGASLLGTGSACCTRAGLTRAACAFVFLQTTPRCLLACRVHPRKDEQRHDK